MKEIGHLLVAEGGVGCGKTTQVRRLRESGVLGCGWEIYREPGSTPFGEMVRQAVQENHDFVVHPYAALFAYGAARANLIRGMVIPRLETGTNVCLDRYWFSTYAYQGAEGISKILIWGLNLIATKGLIPDLVLHYDLLPEAGLNRKSGGEGIDRYDVRELEFHREVRRNYMKLRGFFPGRWETIDASRSIEEVFDSSVVMLKKHHLV